MCVPPIESIIYKETEGGGGGGREGGGAFPLSLLQYRQKQWRGFGHAIVRLNVSVLGKTKQTR